jgi:hypothetical protein
MDIHPVKLPHFWQVAVTTVPLPSSPHTGLYTEQLRNPQRRVKYIIYASGTKKFKCTPLDENYNISTSLPLISHTL